MQATDLTLNQIKRFLGNDPEDTRKCRISLLKQCIAKREAELAEWRENLDELESEPA